LSHLNHKHVTELTAHEQRKMGTKQWSETYKANGERVKDEDKKEIIPS
jgi:hypothetical protein